MAFTGKRLRALCPGGTRVLTEKLYTNDPGVTAIRCPVCGNDAVPGKQAALEDGQAFRTAPVKAGTPFYFVLPAHSIDVVIA